MNNILAQYLFNKETLYKNPQPIEETSEKEIVADKKEIIPAVVSVPVAPSTPIVAPPKPSVAPLKLKHNVLVITDTISDDEKVLLGKILGAVGLSIEQIDLIEIQKTHPIDYPSFIAQKTTTKFISFGIGLSKLNWDLMLIPYQIRTVSGVDFLLANNLGTIATDTNLKKSLWVSLQKMFGR